MNPWHLILPFLGWVLLVFLALLVVFVLLGIVNGIVNFFKKQQSRSGLYKTKSYLMIDPDILLKKTKNQAFKLYKNEIVERHEKILAFVTGAEFILNQIYKEDENNGAS